MKMAASRLQSAADEPEGSVRDVRSEIPLSPHSAGCTVPLVEPLCRAVVLSDAAIEDAKPTRRACALTRASSLDGYNTPQHAPINRPVGILRDEICVENEKSAQRMK